MSKNKNKNNVFNKILYIAGTVVLAVMLAFSVYNFSRDARLLELPVLSREAGVKDVKSTEPGDYKTIKYQKPTEKSKPTDKPVKKTPAPTAKPTPRPIPSSEP